MKQFNGGSKRFRSRMILGACLCIWLIAVLVVQVLTANGRAQDCEAVVLNRVIPSDGRIDRNDILVDARFNIRVVREPIRIPGGSHLERAGGAG